MLPAPTAPSLGSAGVRSWSRSCDLSRHDPCVPAQASRPFRASLPRRKPFSPLRPAYSLAEGCPVDTGSAVARVQASLRKLFSRSPRLAARRLRFGCPSTLLASNRLPCGVRLEPRRSFGPGQAPFGHQTIARRFAALLGLIARSAILPGPRTVCSSEAKKINSSGASCRHRSPEILHESAGALGMPSCP